MSKIKRVYQLEQEVKKVTALKSEYDKVIKSIDLTKSILSQVASDVSIDTVRAIIKDAGNSRSEEFQRVLNSDTKNWSNEEYMLIIVGCDKELLVDEKLFVDAYELLFEKTFFSTNDEAMQNYLSFIQDDKMLELSIKLEDFSY